MDPAGVPKQQHQPAAQDRARRAPSEDDESAARTPSSNLWVGNLSLDTTEKDLTALFGKHGEIESVAAYIPRNYAFIHFRRVDDAKIARDTLQGTLVRGNPIKIDFAKPAKPSKHLWIGGISPTATKEQLKEEFLKFGDIEDFKLLRDRNSAIVEYCKIEDAVEAIKNMNGKTLGDDQLRVDFVRSQPGRRDLPDHEPWMPPESMRGFAESSHRGLKRPLPQGGGHRETPSKILMIRYPPSASIDEKMLHNAMILFGEIERIKCFPGRHYACVEFRSVDEARRAKEGLEGRLFNDPRIQILYSYSDFFSSKDGSFFPGRGPRPDFFYNEPIFGMDMFSTGPMVGPNHFPGPPHPNHFPGPPMHGIPEFNDPWRRSSPPVPGMHPPGPVMRPHFRPTQGPWPDFDSRDPKRSRFDGPGFIDDVPFHARTGDSYGSPQLDRNATGHPIRSPVMGPTAGGSTFEPHGAPRREPCWHGLIAKGGSPVCRARCIPIGKGINSVLPEVVNCSARTGLDMLAKHYAEANGFDIVFFLPDSEEDFASYTEFLRYLGAKNRAGVAKLDDGTTLFLVPPSDFLWNILNVSGPERLYGVVLKLAQLPLSATVQPPQAAPPQTMPYIDRKPLPQASQSLASREEEQHISSENNRAPQEESLPYVTSGKPSLPHAEESRTAPPISLNHSSNHSSSNVEVSLTPELIATLASLVPTNVQSTGVQLPLNSSINPHSFTASGVPDNATPLQGWGPDNRTVVGSVQQEQISHPSFQLSHQSNNQAPMSQYPNYGNVGIPSEIPSQIYPATMEIQGQAMNLQHAAEFPVRHVGNYVYPTQGTNLAASSNNQQYQLNNAYATQNVSYGMPHASDMGGAMNHLAQQSLPSTSLPGQGWLPPQPQPQPQVMMPHVNDDTRSEFPSQLQQLQAALSTQGAAINEVDKNQRYQSTLQFAASLLMQIQQQQQQGGTQSLQGSGKHQ